MCQLTGHTASVQANVFRCALSPRQSGSQISAPLSFKTSCNPVLFIFSLLWSAFNHIYIIIHLIVFVLYCLLLLSLTFLVIKPLGCERDINKQLLLLLLTWQLNMNFKVCSFSQTVQTDLLTDRCNVHGLESHWNKIVFTHEVTIFSVVRAQLISKFFSLTTMFGLAFLSSWRRRFFLYCGTYRLHITADGPYQG